MLEGYSTKCRANNEQTSTTSCTLRTLLLVLYSLLGRTASTMTAAEYLMQSDAHAGNSTRYRVIEGKDDTAGESFTIEVLIRPQAYGVIRGKA